MADKPRVYTLMGPTACGKTALANALYQTGQYELISVDSVLVYRGLDIGSAKPGAHEAPHALVDIRDFWDTYSAGDFREDCVAAVRAIEQRGRKPVLVGGTQMYYKSLLDFESGLPQANAQLRDQIREQARQQGWPALHQQLQQFDPVTAARLHPNHSSRIERALEVYQLSGKPLSEFHASEAQPLFDLVSVALIPDDRAWLHRRIAQRFDIMLEQGFEDELQQLMAHPKFDPTLTSMMSVGYRQGFEWQMGRLCKDAFIERGVIATRQLAKRQLTWLRSWPGLRCVSAEHATLEQVQAAF